jgi:hypothetical protein
MTPEIVESIAHLAKKHDIDGIDRLPQNIEKN